MQKDTYLHIKNGINSLGYLSFIHSQDNVKNRPDPPSTLLFI